MDESGCVNTPRFGRDGNSTPSSIIVGCPMRIAGHGVAGASKNIHALKQLPHFRAEDRAEALRLLIPGRRQKRARKETIHYHRIEILRPGLQVVEVQTAALARSNHVSRGARHFRVRDDRPCA